jgi:hypothetical protein
VTRRPPVVIIISFGAFMSTLISWHLPSGGPPRPSVRAVRAAIFSRAVATEALLGFLSRDVERDRWA